jgi:molecular chaperone Hsp33
MLPPDPGDVEVPSDYVRPRHCVRIVGRFAPIFEGLDLHLLQNGHKVEPEHRALLRETIVACALHHANRPRNEMTGWTINLASPGVNLFTTGDSENQIVCGRVFTENVKETERSRLHAQTTRPHLPIRESVVEVPGKAPFLWAEEFYRKSEQLPARLFRLGGDTYGLVAAQHGFDEAWLDGLTPAAVLAIPEHEELGPLERRRYHFGCGCDLTILRRILRDSVKGDLDALFEGEEVLRVVCPRCAAVFFVRRDEM